MASRPRVKERQEPEPVHRPVSPPRRPWWENVRVTSSGATDGRLSDILGAPHYSYRFAEECFLQMFDRFAVPVNRLKMPEYYADVAALEKPSWASDKIVHLIFRSTEDIRLLKPAYNVACFAWEFDVLADHTFPEAHPFRNQVRMLRICDEVWVPSDYTKRILESHGIENVHAIPAPIKTIHNSFRDRLHALAHLADIIVSPLCINFLLPHETAASVCAAREVQLSHWLADRLKHEPKTKIYLAVLNPEDFRKNIEAMIRGFYYFAQERPDRVLIIKTLTSKSRFSLAQVVSDVVKNKMAPGTTIESQSIVFFNDYLPEADLSWLYQLADFYLCTSIAEGQNLPLLEAMSHGAVPVSTRSTAMLDYINEDDAVIIKTARRLNDNNHLAGTSAGKPFEVDICGHIDVYRALLESASLTQKRWTSLSTRSMEAVKQRFSFERVWALASERLARLAPDVSETMAE